MSIERLFLVDPYDETQRKMLRVFEEENNLKSKTSDYLKTLCTSFPKESYIKSKKESNEIEENLFLEKDSKIIDFCHIQGEKDIKLANISFPFLQNKEHKRKLTILATNYVLEALGMQEVIISLEPEDKNTSIFLENQGLESLGEEKGKILFLKEKEETIKIQRKRE